MTSTILWGPRPSAPSSIAPGQPWDAVREASAALASRRYWKKRWVCFPRRCRSRGMAPGSLPEAPKTCGTEETMRTEEVDVAVIGGGPSGMAAAVAARKAGAERVVLIERGEQLGGILNQCIHDGFGTKIFEEALTGPEYAQIYIDQVGETGVSYYLNTMVLDLTPERELTVCSTEGVRRLRAKSVVLCMGCRERTRGAIGIPGHRPAGVFTAGVVQYYMNLRNLAVGRRVVVLGSGDVGLIMARRLTLEGAQVPCVAEILPYPSGLARNVVQCLEDFGIPLYLDTTVAEIHGSSRVTGVTLAEVAPGGKVKHGSRRRVECDTLMLSVGLIPENELSARAGVKLSPVTRGPVVDDSFQT